MDLYVIDSPVGLDVLTGCAPKKECFWASRVLGSVDKIFLDQHKTPVPWEIVPLPEFCLRPEGDARRNQIVPGYEPTVDDICYDIANAMNRTIQDRGFSRFVKKQIIGLWEAEDSKLEFRTDGIFRIYGSPGPIRYNPPPEGKWYAGGRMLHLMTESNDRGVRVALVSVSDSELRFHGRDGVLFHVYRKKA
jgi:hypothetical protein